jgi:iron-sulfur cluster repair protein YtfE (RIC family)
MNQLAASSPGADRQSALAELSEALSLHMEVEETRVYPIIEEVLDADSAAEAESEHNEARELLARLAERVDDPAFVQTLAELQAATAEAAEEMDG